MATKRPITVRAPARIDLAGGTADIWPICLLEKDAVTVNLAIDRYATATVKLRDDGRYFLVSQDREAHAMHTSRESLGGETKLALHREVALAFGGTRGIEVRTRSGVPQGSGLGGSSALFVAAVKAACDATETALTDREFLRVVTDMEARILGVPTGSQDYVAAMYGGLSVIRFPPGGPERRASGVDAAALASRLVLAWTGLPHDSATNNWAITKAYLDGSRTVRKHMGAISAAARDLDAALTAGDLDAAAAAVDAEWTARKRLAPDVSTPTIEAIGKAARKAGAQAVKVCGAGGGGCMIVWSPVAARSEVAKAVAASGGEVLKFEPAPTGALRA